MPPLDPRIEIVGRGVIGGNNPPDMTVTTLEIMRDISNWLSEHPAIPDAESAREAKVFMDRGRLSLKDMEDERDGKVRPLNEKVTEINRYYKAPKEAITRVLMELGTRISTFLKEEERKRVAAAAEATRIAEEAERRAREAEAAEQEAIGAASSGELGIDVAAHVVEADCAFREYQVAGRAAARAERETHVKIGGGFSRSLSLKKKETLAVYDAPLALKAIGLTEDIMEAIIKSARAYRKLNGKLPDGVESTVTKEI